MDIVEFGKRVLLVREKVLKMNQVELAQKINTSQALLSRLETGIGGNINIVFDLINYLQQQGLFSHMLFREPFDIELLYTKDKMQSPKEKIMDVIQELKTTATINFEKAVLLHSLFTESDE